MSLESRKAQHPEEILQQLVQLAPVIKQAIPFNTTIAVTDTEKFLTALPFDGDDRQDVTGMPLPDGDAVKEAMQRKETLLHTVDAKLFGIAFKAGSTPILNEEGQVIGGLGIGISLENQQKLQEMAEHMAGMYEKILSATDELATSAQDLSSIMGMLADVQIEMKDQFKNTDQILGLIHSVTETTKLLGLNAAIESARAGEYGRGFGVVAQEIRKLADDSSASVKKIRELLEILEDKVERLNVTVEQVTRISNQQTAASQEVSESVQELKTVVQDIEQVAKVI